MRISFTVFDGLKRSAGVKSTRGWSVFAPETVAVIIRLAVAAVHEEFQYAGP